MHPGPYGHRVLGASVEGESANARYPAPVHPVARLRAGPRLHLRGRSRWHAVGSAARCLRPDYPRPPRLTALIDPQQMASLGSGVPRQSLALVHVRHRTALGCLYA